MNKTKSFVSACLFVLLTLASAFLRAQDSPAEVEEKVGAFIQKIMKSYELRNNFGSGWGANHFA